VPIAAVSSARDELNCALAAEVLRKFGTIQFRAIGSSMIPAVWPGDILQVRSAGIDEIAVGDVILFWRDSAFCAHRVLLKRGQSLVTGGDSVSTSDRPITQTEVLGRVVALSRNGKTILVQRRLSFPKQGLAYLLRRWNWSLRSYIRCHGVIARMRVPTRFPSPGSFSRLNPWRRLGPITSRGQYNCDSDSGC
jgi:hypothetical protein